MMKIFFLTSLKLCLVATKFNISNIQKVTPDVHHDDDHTDMSETKLKSYHQFVTCYNNEQLSEVLGNKFKTTDYIPDLKTISFDNMISSCNVTGVWLFYDRVNYSGSTTFWAIFLSKSQNSSIIRQSVSDLLELLMIGRQAV